MKPKEFDEIKKRFLKEDKRWKALKVGDTIYDSVARGFDIDYHKAEIKEIDLEERFVFAYDRSDRTNPNNIIKLYGFLTQEEFDNVKF